MNSWKSRGVSFWEKYEYKIILAAGFVLVAVISFEAGALKGAKIQQKPIIIEKPAGCPQNQENSSQDPAGSQKSAQVEPKAENGTNTQPQNCAFVGSKNSNKYHLPTCRYAKGIKLENKVCFSSTDEAQSRGYLPDKNCIK